jgi:hypothetical protein
MEIEINFGDFNDFFHCINYQLKIFQAITALFCL